MLSIGCRASCIVAIIATALLFSSGRAVHASIEQEFAKSARLLGKEMQQQQIGTLRLKVDEPVQIASSLPNTIRQILATELKSHGIQLVAANAQRILHVKSVFDQSDPDGAGEINFTFDLLAANGQHLQTLDGIKFTLSKPQEILDTLGVPVDPSNKRTGVTRPAGPGDVQNALPQGSRPPVSKPAVTGTIVRAHADGMFGMEILVNGRAVVPIADAGGNVMLTLKEQDTYEVRLINESPFDTAVALRIDGIDSGSFSKDKKALWIVRAGTDSTIRGWLQTTGQSGKSAKFQIVPPEQSVAAPLGKIGEVGVIQAMFFRAYRPGENQDPVDRGSPAGTGLGEEFPWVVQEVRDIVVGNKFRASVVAKYEKN